MWVYASGVLCQDVWLFRLLRDCHCEDYKSACLRSVILLESPALTKRRCKRKAFIPATVCCMHAHTAIVQWWMKHSASFTYTSSNTTVEKFSLTSKSHAFEIAYITASRITISTKNIVTMQILIMHNDSNKTSVCMGTGGGNAEKKNKQKMFSEISTYVWWTEPS